MNNSSLTNHARPKHKSRPMVDLLVSIIIPSVILMNLSGGDDLGASGALIVALAFPVSWGLFELFKYKKFNFIALLGLIMYYLPVVLACYNSIHNGWRLRRRRSQG